MEKDPNINPELLDLLWLAELQKTQENSQEEESLRLEYSSQKHISFSRSKEAAYRQDLLSLAEQQHINNCSHCEARLRGFQRNTHPLNSVLFLNQIGLASELLRAAIKIHLDNECSKCNEKINGWLGKIANRLKVLIYRRKVFLDYICHQLDNNLSFGSREVNFIGSFASQSEQYQITELLNLIFEDEPLTLVIQQVPGNQLRIAVISSDLFIEYSHVEIVGQNKVIAVNLVLTIDEQRAIGEVFLSDFDEIIQELGQRFDVFAIPIDKAIYEELLNA